MTAYFIQTAGSILKMDAPPAGSVQAEFFYAKIASGEFQVVPPEKVATVEKFTGFTAAGKPVTATWYVLRDDEGNPLEHPAAAEHVIDAKDAPAAAPR